MSSPVIKDDEGADGHAGISAVPTDLLCKRGCDVVQAVGDIPHSLIYLQ